MFFVHFIGIFVVELISNRSITAKYVEYKCSEELIEPLVCSCLYISNTKFSRNGIKL